jgi:hypothetical protein
MEIVLAFCLALAPTAWRLCSHAASHSHPQVRREQIVTHNPLFAAVVLPNMIKELVGWKKQ